jgi:tRNA-Thr(GGU) m(6)t(6)A37 methyltransferase TsaA
MRITIKSIGIAKNQNRQHFGGWKDVMTKIIINKKYQDGLEGLKDYSHVLVLFWMHEVKTCELRHVPQGKIGEVPEVGIFACRCVQRPNPIGVSIGEIITIKGSIITLKGLDVIDNTPIIDIKPYTPQYDTLSDVKTPDWVNKLEY